MRWAAGGQFQSSAVVRGQEIAYLVTGSLIFYKSALNYKYIIECIQCKFSFQFNKAGLQRDADNEAF